MPRSALSFSAVAVQVALSPESVMLADMGLISTDRELIRWIISVAAPMALRSAGMVAEAEELAGLDFEDRRVPGLLAPHAAHFERSEHPRIGARNAAASIVWWAHYVTTNPLAPQTPSTVSDILDRVIEALLSNRQLFSDREVLILEILNGAEGAPSLRLAEELADLVLVT